MVQQWLANIFLAAIELVVALALTVLSAYTSIGLLDRLTRNLDEWKEIKKGNAAVGIVILALILATLLIAGPRILSAANFYYGFPFLAFLGIFIARLLNLIITLILSIWIMIMTVRLFDHLTVDIDENAELRKGNIAMALVLAALILGIAWVAKDVIFLFVDALGIELWIRQTLG